MPFIFNPLKVIDARNVKEIGTFSYEGLAVVLEQLMFGGIVRVSGKGVQDNIQIGAGLADLLAHIPEAGATSSEIGLIETFTDIQPANKRMLFIEDMLIPKGLIEKQGNTYEVSHAALKAQYTVFGYAYFH